MKRTFRLTVSRRRVKLLKFGLKLLVDKQQSFHCGAVIYTLSTVGPTVTESLTTDTGSSASDKITSNDALTGSGAANTVVTLKEGTTVLGTTTADGSGHVAATGGYNISDNGVGTI